MALSGFPGRFGRAVQLRWRSIRARLDGLGPRGPAGLEEKRDAEGDRPMHASSTILVAILTSLATTMGTVYVIERYGLVPPRAETVPNTVVPDLHGVTESDAR